MLCYLVQHILGKFFGQLNSELSMTKITISVNEKKAIISDFLEKCNVYSEQMLEKYNSKLSDHSVDDKKVIEEKIQKWLSYQEFNEYALRELKTEELDSWLID